MRRTSGSRGDDLANRTYTRGRAMLAAARIRRAAKESGASALSLDDINALIRAARKARSRGGRRL